jgi:hypothetical protein
MTTLDQSLPQAQARSQQPNTATRVIWIGIGVSFVFTLIIWLAGPWLEPTRAILLPDAGVSWYYWKLPEPTLITQLSAWIPYLIHQVVFWGLIWYAQTRVKKYTSGLHMVNFLALGLNALFVLIHFAQTHLWYDGLAQDVSIFSSQGSVIVLLIWIMVMENNRRGTFWGKKLPIGKRVIHFARKYHGYYFAWAIVWTYWYHPMETTPGHLLGFFYTFLLLLQGSLFFTRIHTNKWWMIVQEVTVLAHGTIVAVVQSLDSGRSIWPMFFFGFFGVFVVTQMHGLGLKTWMKWAVVGVFIACVILVYVPGGEYNRLNEIVRIPAIYYIAMIAMALLVGLGIFIVDRFRVKQIEAEAAAAPSGD